MSHLELSTTFVRSRWFLGALCLVISSLTGCSGSTDGEGNQNNNNAEGCHYDCLPDYRCENGTVFEKAGGVIPCSDFESTQQAAQMCDELPVSEYRTCQEGCRSDVSNVDQFPSYTPELCAEDKLAQPGDPCVEDSDCTPTDFDIGPMFCESGQCVDPGAPQDAGMDAGDAAEDTSAPDTGNSDTGTDDTGPEDTGTDDTGPADTGPADTGPEDTGPADTGTDDTGQPDTGPADTGDPDTGTATDTADDDAADTGDATD